ncbi:helix-turn-helix transcriptional regulator [Halegenticoccus soli]|uniref:helix-turn-helix transcriptional regulator n=1 Tax=Halegenticoccus soli TaxID=1985678 RepID=UPI000C6D83B6|nr:ArsR family transcriptional regulator [Halegenticoccus soli]
MAPALEDIRFLADSEHRVSALEELMEEPRTQVDLRTATGASSATISRLLRSFGERGWIARDGNDYALTPLGRFVAEEFVRLYDRMRSADRLRGVIEYLPIEEFDFDLRRLADARITRPTQADTIAPIRREVELMTACTDRFQMLVTAVDRLATQEVAELVRRVPVFEGIYTLDAMNAVKADPAMREDLDRYMRAGGDLYLYDGDTSMVTLGLNDGTVGFELNDGRGFVPAFVETDDEAVVSWAERTYERYKREAERVDVDAFAA